VSGEWTIKNAVTIKTFFSVVKITEVLNLRPYFFHTHISTKGSITYKALLNKRCPGTTYPLSIMQQTHSKKFVVFTRSIMVKFHALYPQPPKFVHAHLDDTYAITRTPRILIFGVWVKKNGFAMGWSSSLSKINPVRFSHSPTSSFQFLYSPYPSPGAQSLSKYFTGCSLPAGGIQ
jgi:hypothetical protein